MIKLSNRPEDIFEERRTVDGQTVNTSHCLAVYHQHF
jgi:hypothetical protein